MYDAERIEKPPYFAIRPTMRGRGKRKPYIIGFDSEADDSKPFMFQFSEPGGTEDDVMVVPIPERENAGLNGFMWYIVRRLLGEFGRDHEVIFYGWNLGYEWTQLFHDLIPEMRTMKEITLYVSHRDDVGHVHEFVWTVYNDKRMFAKIEHLGTKRQFRILDGMMFYKTGLDRAAKMLGLGEKYKPNDGCTVSGAWHEHDHDNAYITRELENDPEFLTYARRDAYITRLVGEQIVSLHDGYDIRQTISAPHFASSVFKRQFLTREVEQPDPPLEQAGLWSYHGGKNGFYLPGPARVLACWQYDITSAYPEAMRQLPDIELADWHVVRDYAPGRHAIYVVTMEYKRCQYRGMMSHDGHWPESGYIEDICLTSYELDAMMERGEARIITCHGWEMTGEAGGPLERYVDVFFAQKARTEGAERETAKLMLNSLYGKFFQKIVLGELVGSYDFDNDRFIETDPAREFDWRAGGLYHPPIASLITGFVRAKIHRLEHKYDAIMTSTDGFFAYKAPDAADIGKQLGMLTAQHGDLSIWRERLYIFDSPELVGDDGKPKPKAAYHGYWSDLEHLRAMPLRPGRYEYESRHMVTLKESMHAFDGKYYEPGSFIVVPRYITL